MMRSRRLDILKGMLASRGTILLTSAKWSKSIANRRLWRFISSGWGEEALILADKLKEKRDLPFGMIPLSVTVEHFR